MKTLLTGATGFVGRAVLRQLVEREIEVAALVRPENADTFSSNCPEVRIISGTLADPAWRQIASFAPEACIHCAWLATPGVYMDSPENERYVTWSLQLCEGLARLGLKHLIALGTGIEYAPRDEPLKEDSSPLDPRSPYARAKNRFRESLFQSPQLAGTRLAWGRVFYPYGPGDLRGRVITRFAQTLLQGKTLALQTPHSIKDFIYIDDLAEAIMCLRETNFHGTINLATGVGTSVETMAKMLNSMANRGSLIEAIPGAPPDPYPFHVADVARLRELGFAPKTNLADGLHALLDYVRRSGRES